MKKKILILGLCLLMVSGCGKKIPQLSSGEDAVVTFEDGSMISADALYEKVKNSYALDALINMIDTKILEVEYADQIEEAKNYADVQIMSLEAQYGDETEAVIRYNTGYSSITAYKDYLYLSYLQNLAIEDYAKDKVTDKEVEAYYKNKTKGDVKLSHILITPEVTNTMTDDEKKKAEDEAQETIKKIIKELQNVKSSEVATKFEELAKEYSEDSSSVSDGGNLGFMNYGTLGANYDELVDAAYKLSNKEFSTTVITTELGYHVIFRTDIKDKPELDDVRDSIIETLAYEKLDEDKAMVVTALQELRKKHGVDIIDSEIKTQYANYIQNALASYKNTEGQ